MKKKFTLKVEVEVAPDIAEKYPNYRLNYKSPEDFIESIKFQITDQFMSGGISPDNMLEEYGYKVTIKE